MKPAWEVLETSGRVWRWDGRWEQSEEGLGEVLVRTLISKESRPSRETHHAHCRQPGPENQGDVIGCDPHTLGACTLETFLLSSRADEERIYLKFIMRLAWC